MFKFQHVVTVLAASLLIPFVVLDVAAQEKPKQFWTINVINAKMGDVFGHLEEIFRYMPINPTASCLRQTVTFHSEKQWSSDDAKELVSQIMANACCDVSFKGDEYTLQPISQRNELCESSDVRGQTSNASSIRTSSTSSSTSVSSTSSPVGYLR